MMRRFVPLAVAVSMIASIAVLATASPAAACSCVEVDDAVAFADADAVFVGQVTREHPARDGGAVSLVIMTVSDVFKGDVDREQAVVTPETDCGIDFIGGRTYVVFARDTATSDQFTLDDGFLLADLCSGTRLATDVADGDLALRGTPSGPADAGPPTSAEIKAQLGDPRSSLFPEALIFVGVLAFVLGLAAVLSRRGRPTT
jgi:hypothetical protein